MLDVYVCVCAIHTLTLAQISYGVFTCLLFKSIFLLRFRAGIDVKLCKLLPQFIEKFTSIKGEYFCIFLNNLSPAFFTGLKIVLSFHEMCMSLDIFFLFFWTIENKFIHKPAEWISLQIVYKPFLHSSYILCVNRSYNLTVV